MTRFLIPVFRLALVASSASRSLCPIWSICLIGPASYRGRKTVSHGPVAAPSPQGSTNSCLSAKNSPYLSDRAPGAMDKQGEDQGAEKKSDLALPESLSRSKR